MVKRRPHVMNLVVETDNLVDGQRQRPKSLQKEASDSFGSMLLPTSRIMRAAREKNTQTSQRPRVLHHSQLYPCLRWRQKHVGHSLSPQVPHVGSKPSLLWPPRSVPQSCRLKSNRIQHLHRLQVVSVASGRSQSVPLASSMPMSVDPSVSSTMFGLLYKHIFLHAVRGKAKHLLHLSAVKHGACETDTEPRLHLRLTEPLATDTSTLTKCPRKLAQNPVASKCTNFHHGHRSMDGCASNQVQKGHSRSIHEVACPALCTRQSDSFRTGDTSNPRCLLLARWAFSSMLLNIKPSLNEEELHTRRWRRRSDRRRG